MGRVLLAAGGTGGHIYPAVALAESLAALAPGVVVQFCCGNRPAEWQIYRRLGIDPWILPVAHNRPGLRERLQFLRQMTSAWSTVRRHLRLEPVQVAVGFGGYVSVAPLLAARFGGARLALHEQNVHPGAANRFLARFARLIATGAPLPPGTFPAARTRYVGNPIRADILRPVERMQARDYFRLSHDRLVCLIIGGSQGALGLNKMITNLLCRLRNLDSPAARWQVLWSTGTAHFDDVRRAMSQLRVDPAEHSVNPYIDEMPLAYAAADVIVARSGALTLAELTAVGLPAVLVPLPSAAGGHQLFNARRLAQAGAAEIIEEADPRGDEKLEALLGRWAADPDALAKMAAASRGLGKPAAGRDLAKLVLELLPNRPSMT